MAWPPQFDEELHPRGRGGKFAKKPGAPDTPARRGRPLPPAQGRPGPQPPAQPQPPKPAAPAKATPAKAAPAKTPAKKAAKAAPPPSRPRRRAMRYNEAEAAPQLQQQPERPAEEEARLGDGPKLDTGSQATGNMSLPGTGGPTVVPIGGDGPRAMQLAVGRRADGSMDWEQRAAYVDERLTYMRNNGIDSESEYRDENGDWKPERAAQQEALMDEIWETRAAHVPNEGRGIFSGGLGGAGKGYALGKVEKVSDREFFTVNPDDVKELMAKRGMIPTQLDPTMTPMELSPVVHEEASEMAKRLAERAYAERKNLVWDITMSSPGSVMGRVNAMREAGYTHIGALFVDTTVERSIAQARKRWYRGMEEYMDGEGDGGRYLPSKATAENLPSPGSAYHSKNREVFEAIKGNFDGAVLYENLDGNMRQMETQGKGLPK